MIRILLLDDHAVVRAGYRQLIDAEPDMQVLAEAATSPQACELLSRTGVDLAVVDLSLRGDSGTQRRPRVSITTVRGVEPGNRPGARPGLRWLGATVGCTAAPRGRTD